MGWSSSINCQCQWSWCAATIRLHCSSLFTELGETERGRSIWIADDELPFWFGCISRPFTIFSIFLSSENAPPTLLHFAGIVLLFPVVLPPPLPPPFTSSTPLFRLVLEDAEVDGWCAVEEDLCEGVGDMLCGRLLIGEWLLLCDGLELKLRSALFPCSELLTPPDGVTVSKAEPCWLWKPGRL